MMLKKSKGTYCLMGQIYKNLLTLSFVALFLLPVSSCNRNLAPAPTRKVSGKAARRARIASVRRGWQAFRYKRKNERLTRKSERRIKRGKRAQERAERKLREMHVKKQTPEVQKRMKESRKTAELNNTRLTLRQRLHLWLYKFKRRK